MEIKNLTKKEMLEINGGGFKEAAISVFWYGFKYSSLTGAFLTGIAEGYYSEK